MFWFYVNGNQKWKLDEIVLPFRHMFQICYATSMFKILKITFSINRIILCFVIFSWWSNWILTKTFSFLFIFALFLASHFMNVYAYKRMFTYTRHRWYSRGAINHQINITTNRILYHQFNAKTLPKYTPFEIW